MFILILHLDSQEMSALNPISTHSDEGGGGMGGKGANRPLPPPPLGSEGSGERASEFVGMISHKDEKYFSVRYGQMHNSQKFCIQSEL